MNLFESSELLYTNFKSFGEKFAKLLVLNQLAPA